MNFMFNLPLPQISYEIYLASACIAHGLSQESGDEKTRVVNDKMWAIRYLIILRGHKKICFKISM